jgi:hypothetical protein
VEVLPTWKLWLARVGLVVSFRIFFTIPGWFALAGYRRWRKGKGVKPAAALFWGYWTLLGLVLSAPALILAAIHGAFA